MAYFREIPYTTLSQLNLDWLIKGLQTLETEIGNFVALNTIKYANPFDWDITAQYAMNTLVFNPADYTAYLSVKPVPSGVQIDNTDYWTPVFTLKDVLTAYRDAITPVFEQAGSPATTTIEKGQLFWIESGIYYATAKINQGDTVAIGTNCAATNISEELLKLISADESLSASIESETGARVQADNALSESIASETEAREQADNALSASIASETNARVLADTGLQQDINNINTVIANIKVPTNYLDHLRYYIDAINGNDDNDGSQGAPFKTLDKFLSLYNSESTDMRCFIVSAGTYTISKPVLQGITLHITSTVPGVTIKALASEEPFVFYNSHINFQGSSPENFLTFDCEYGRTYGDNCLYTLKYVHYICAFWTYFCGVDAQNCTFTYIRSEKSNLDLYGGTVMTATADVNAYLIFLDQCQGRLTGNFTLPQNDPAEGQMPNSCIITSQNSFYSIEFTAAVGANKRQNGIRSTNSAIFVTESRLTAIKNCGTSGNYMIRNFTVTDNATLPIPQQPVS